MTAAEEWRSIQEWPNYEASSLGRIRHKKRLRPLKPNYGNKGRYARVTIHGRNGQKSLFVHVLVANAFFGPKPDGLTINHRDGVKRNNGVCNLEYISLRENWDHAIANGLWTFGERNGRAKISEDDVKNIRALYGTMPMSHIGEMFGISRPCVGYIVRRETWKHVA
jgi:hypothetical protein